MTLGIKKCYHIELSKTKTKMRTRTRTKTRTRTRKTRTKTKTKMKMKKRAAQAVNAMTSTGMQNVIRTRTLKTMVAPKNATIMTMMSARTPQRQRNLQHKGRLPQNQYANLVMVTSPEGGSGNTHRLTACS